MSCHREARWALRVDGRPSPIAVGEGPSVIPWAGQLAKGRLLPDGGYTLSLRREGEADWARGKSGLRPIFQQPKTPEVFEAIRRSEVAFMNAPESQWRLDDQDKP